MSSPIEAATAVLVKGEVLAFVQGRFEWGPRALGNRSILSLPTPLAVKERLNRVIKRREPFRPFAPMVLEDSAQNYFGSFAQRLAPFMTTIAEVLPEARGKLEAVTHVDGTARLQTVRRDSVIGTLLARVEQDTSVPVLLNTSLNGQGEPIVATEADALAFFLAHPRRRAAHRGRLDHPALKTNQLTALSPTLSPRGEREQGLEANGQ